MTTGPSRTFPELLDTVLGQFRQEVFLPRRHSRGGEAVRFGDLVLEARRLAAGLLATGVRRGDRVGLISENRFEWILSDLACALIGAADVPRGTDTAVAELTFILRHSGATFAFVETAEVARELLQCRRELPDLRAVCVMTGEVSVSAPDDLEVTTLGQLAQRGDELLASDPGTVERAGREVEPDDNLTIVYTSGTTADPKGVMLTHCNVLTNMRMIDGVLRFSPADSCLSVLPSWHAYERIINYVALSSGSKLIYSDRRRLKEDLREVRPTIFAGVPRIWETIHDGIVAHARKQKWPMRLVLAGAIASCRRVGAGQAGPLGRAAHWAYARTILPKFLGATGGRLRIAVSGGGSLPAHVDEMLLGMGLPLINGYGLTETSPVASVRLPERNCPGTIGPPLPGTEIEIRGEDGRPVPQGRVGLVWIRGPQVMRGYYANPERTAEVLDADGWFNSGDLGLIEDDGQIRITGRAKDTIVLAGGENVEPEQLETALKTSPFIDQAIVVGQDKKTLGAIIVPIVECLEQEIPRSAWGEVNGTLESPEVRAFYRREIDRLLSRARGFRPLERVTSFRVVLEPLTIENGLLTQTLKVKRHKVNERLGGLIEEMFG